MKFYEGVWGGKRNKWINFGGDLDHNVDCPIQNPAITQQIMNGLQWKFQDSSAMMQGTID